MLHYIYGFDCDKDFKKCGFRLGMELGVRFKFGVTVTNAGIIKWLYSTIGSWERILDKKS